MCLTKIFTTIGIILLSSLLCFSADDYVIGGPDSFKGEWSNPCTKSILIINVEGGSIFTINFIDKSTFKRTFDITNIKWDGEALSFTCRCIETGHTTNHIITSSNVQCKINDNITGDSKAKTTWSKKQCQILNGS
jgi:hypothetical protein